MLTETRNSGKAQTEALSTDNGSSGLTRNQRIEKALANLRQAARRKRVEPICNTYHELRDACEGMSGRDMLLLASKALGKTATKLLVSAFSHRFCFMCKDGVVQCDRCKGSGLIDVEAGRICTRCNGIGVVACGFCMGTGWSDRSSFPPELLEAVIHRQLAHTQKELKNVVGIVSALNEEKIAKLPDDMRKTFTSRLIQLQARLIDMAGIEIVDETEGLHMSALANKIGLCLDLLAKRS